jgi:F-type H+-transporting ATPase subunit b
LTEINIRFETAPELISGIELISNEQKVAWSIADYLVSLEKGVAELLEKREQAEHEIQEKTHKPVKTEPKPVTKNQ